MAIALDMQKGITHEDSNVIEFPVIDVASAIGWDSGVVKSHLKNLEWMMAGKECVHKVSPLRIFLLSLEHFIHTIKCVLQLTAG